VIVPIEPLRRDGYSHDMRALIRLLLMFAVVLMPLGMTPATAAPAHHDMASMGHCPDQTPGHDQKAGFAECTMACAAALPAVEAPAAQGSMIGGETPRLAAANRLHGLHPETATPPPRAS
jgi:hypothetical protein